MLCEVSDIRREMNTLIHWEARLNIVAERSITAFTRGVKPVV
jgi:hypothetical protein